MRFPKKRDMSQAAGYGATPVEQPCFYGFSHRSQLERAVCALIRARELAGEIIHEKHEDRVAIGRAKYVYFADFRVRDAKTSEVFWIEAKGNEKGGRWPTTKRQWQAYGPGKLEVWKGSYKRPFLAKTIYPEAEQLSLGGSS